MAPKSQLAPRHVACAFFLAQGMRQDTHPRTDGGEAAVAAPQVLSSNHRMSKPPAQVHAHERNNLHRLAGPGRLFDEDIDARAADIGDKTDLIRAEDARRRRHTIHSIRQSDSIVSPKL